MMILLAALSLLLAPAAPAGPVKVEGLVVSQDGTPVQGVSVRLESAPNSAVVTGERGHFSIEVSSFPAVLLVGEERLSLVRVTLRSPAPLRVTLQSLPQLVDEVVVTGVSGDERFAPAGAALSRVERSETILPDGRVADLLTQIPGVALNGQGGQFQVYSIRGMSRNRILTSISGVRLTSERRAGVSTSFLDPLLLEELDVIRGPASSYYGSGAVGGVVEMQPRKFQGQSLQAGWGSQGDEGYLAAGWGDRHWSVGVAGRRADDSRMPDGGTINSHYRRLSGTLMRDWVSPDRTFHLLVLPAFGENIGKPNTDYPERTAGYPRERHLIAEFSGTTSRGVAFELFAHPQDLLTETLDSEGKSEVRNESTDFGLKSSKEFTLIGGKSLRMGFDYFGRRKVSATENAVDFANSNQVTQLRTLDNALEDEFGLQLSGSFPLGPSVLEAGGRWLLLRQENGGSAPSFSDTAGSGYAGILLPIRHGLQLTGSVGSGVRFPSLGERYYSGTTGRGEVIGNSSLNPERSVDLEGGIRGGGTTFFAGVTVFQNWIDQYIERIEVAPDVLTYRNLISGEIRGVEWETAWSPSDKIQLFARGHFLRGSDTAGAPLSDIPVHRLGTGFRYKAGGWKAGADCDFLAAKNDPGSGEKVIPRAHPFSTFAAYNVASGVEFFVRITNLFNESFFATADRKSVLEPGRSVRIGVGWSSE